MPSDSRDALTSLPDSSIDEFVATAAEYCSLIEGHQQYSPRDFLAKVRELLPVLYYRALRLPEVESSHDMNHRDITTEQWGQMFVQLQEFLGPQDQYWEIFDPIKKAVDDPNLCSLSDDLADIWRDLKNGLMHWDGVSGSSDIVWEWHFSFHGHWSDHAVDALRTINWLTEYYDVGETD
ncbi:MAG: DUF5063 domain-containing protein [Pirellulaceae bacterium]